MATTTRSRENASSILFVGPVNLKTGKNKMFGEVQFCWSYNPEERVFAVRNEKGQVFAVVGGSSESIGDVIPFRDDQTNRWYGFGTVIAIATWDAEGLKQLAQAIGRNSINIATYK